MPMDSLSTRMKKTLVDKYGVADITGEIIQFRKDNRKLYDDEEMFNNLPYLGILYIPINLNFVKFWSDFKTNTLAKNQGIFLKTKVCSVDNERAKVYYYNDHEGWIVENDFDHQDYLVVGNELEEKPHVVAKRLLVRGFN